MSHETNNLKLEIPQPNVDLADLTIVSDNFEKVDAFAGDIATIETSPTTKAHSAGEFIIYEGRIYKVTSAISAGGSLVLGTNVSAANLGTELKSLRDSVCSTRYISSTLALNDTYQIPSDVLSHNCIVVGLRRYGRSDYRVIPKAEITDGALDGHVTFFESQNSGWYLTISSTGLIQLAGMNNTTTSPSVIVYGIN